MNAKIFVDTNILVYSVANDLHKRTIADHLLMDNEIVISPQVISEFVAVTLRKQILAQPKVIDYAKKFMQVFQVTVLTSKTITSALDIMTRYQLAYWDSLILAAALESSCTWLYTEDLQDGQLIENTLTIHNPFHQP
jgi:predicted nucleic acid-binding protein